jgi:NADPH2:quinone reductase
MSKARRIHETGGPEVLRWEEFDPGAPGEGQVLVRHTAIGVNYIDSYHRTGLYAVPLPSVLGVEGAGVVEAVGPGVTNFRMGERVAYAGGPPGAYAERRVIAATHLVHLPENIGDQDAAAMLLQGLTVHSLIHRTYPVKKGDTVLWHAAAGGVGLIACQWLKALGVTVIGTVSSDEKAELARANGCTHTIVYTRENFSERVRELTGGSGVPVVFDSVGKTTWEGSLDSLSPLGMMVSFGNSSGVVPPFGVGQLAAKGSLFLTRPVLGTYMAKREDLKKAAAALFDVVSSGKVQVKANQLYALKDAELAHRVLEARKTTGATVLTP